MGWGMSGRIDIANGSRTVQAFSFKKMLFVPELAWMFDLDDFLILSTSGVQSRSNGWLEQIGGYHKMLIGSLNQNTSRL